MTWNPTADLKLYGNAASATTSSQDVTIATSSIPRNNKGTGIDLVKYERTGKKKSGKIRKYSVKTPNPWPSEGLRSGDRFEITINEVLTDLDTGVPDNIIAEVTAEVEV